MQKKSAEDKNILFKHSSEAKFSADVANTKNTATIRQLPQYTACTTTLYRETVQSELAGLW